MGSFSLGTTVLKKYMLPNFADWRATAPAPLNCPIVLQTWNAKSYRQKLLLKTYARAQWLKIDKTKLRLFKVTLLEDHNPPAVILHFPLLFYLFWVFRVYSLPRSQIFSSPCLPCYPAAPWSNSDELISCLKAQKCQLIQSDPNLISIPFLCLWNAKSLSNGVMEIQVPTCTLLLHLPRLAAWTPRTFSC